MKYDILREFKDIERQIRFFCTPGYAQLAESSPNGVNLGCHARVLSNINLCANWNTLSTTNPKNPVKHSNWGGVSEEELNQISAKINNIQLTNEEREGIFRGIAESFNKVYEESTVNWGKKEKGMPSGPSIVIMSDNMNSYTPEFPKNSGIHDPNKVPNFKTSDFVQWLIKNNYGIVFGSPITRNQYHQDKENYSMVQAWFWIPPNFSRYCAPDSHFVSGLDQIPSPKKWYSDVKKAIGKENLTDEELDARLWKGGKRNSHKQYVEVK